MYLAGVLSVFVCAGVSSVWAVSTNQPATVLYGYFSVTSFLEAVAMFVFIKEYCLSRAGLLEKYRNFFSIVSGYTLGVYLTHYIVIMLFQKYSVITTRDFNAILSVPCIALLTFVISTFITAVLNKIPFVGKWIV